MTRFNTFPTVSSILLLTFCTLHGLTSGAGKLVIYWGQNGNEGSLAKACQSGLYNILLVAFLSEFGENRPPKLNLAGHCDPPSGTCNHFSSDISTCQNLGIKVLLSIGGGAGSYGLSSTDDAASVANYIWNNYLGGHSSNRPLGSAVLDGVDFDIEGGNGVAYYGTLAQALRQLSPGVILGAAPQCPFSDAHLGPNFSGSALASGLFNYVWVQFYNNHQCEYGSDASALLKGWQDWTSAGLPQAQILLGLPASPEAANSGYILPDTLLANVLPQIRGSSNYGGVMLFSYYYDEIARYSSAIKPGV